jgi:hypothetical protein
MAPTQIGQQTDATTVMGFEETTNTPGTTCDLWSRGSQQFVVAAYLKRGW